MRGRRPGPAVAAGAGVGENVDCRIGGLELLPKLVFRGTRQDFAVLSDIYVACKYFWPILAGLCAERCSPEVAAGLLRLVDKMERTDDLRERHWAIMQMRNWLADNCGSPVFQLLANSILSVTTTLIEVSTPETAFALRSTERYRQAAEAVVSGEPDRARIETAHCWDWIWDNGIRWCAGMVKPR